MPDGLRARRVSISNAVDAVYERPELGWPVGEGRAAVLVGTGFPKSYPTGDPLAYPAQEARPALVTELRERIATPTARARRRRS